MEKRITDFIKFINHKRKGKSPYAAEFLSGKNRVLDIGCGGGELERQFYRFLGLDISLKNLRKSDILCKGRLIQGDATMLPIKDESFEGIMLCNVIEHLYPEQALLALREIDRVLKKGGCFLLATQLERKGNFNTFTHKRPYPPISIQKLLLAHETDEPVINRWKVKGIYYIGRFSKNRFLYFIFWFLANFGIGARDYCMVIEKTIQ